MGKIIKVKAATIKPSQDFLKEDTLAYITKNYEKGDFDKLPPTPIVRRFSDTEYIAIDGHNLLAFYAMKDMDCDVYVAENANDGIVGNSEMILKRNSDLLEKFENVIDVSEEIAKKGIYTIKDLCGAVIKRQD